MNVWRDGLVCRIKKRYAGVNTTEWVRITTVCEQFVWHHAHQHRTVTDDPVTCFACLAGG